jgi:hypothetical protein
VPCINRDHEQCGKGGSDECNHRRIDALKLAAGFEAALAHVNVTRG